MLASASSVAPREGRSPNCAAGSTKEEEEEEEEEATTWVVTFFSRVHLAQN